MQEQYRCPEHLHIIPYVPGLAEYAAQVRSELIRREGTDIVIAADFPAGLEHEVCSAVKDLPKVSVIVDQLRRAIPVIPTSAPIEAVRSYQEYGLDLKFIDTSLPVTGNVSEYQYFVDLCRRHGLEKVLSNAESLGISPGDIMNALISRFEGHSHMPPFAHLPGIVPSAPVPDFDPSGCSPYLETRLRSMAMKVRHLLDDGNDLLLVCSFAHAGGILHYLDEPDPAIDDSYAVPARSWRIGASTIPFISREIPYFMYLYELYRDLPVEREGWIKDLYCSTEKEDVAANMVDGVMHYACRLAIADKELFPGLYNIIAAAKFIAGDEYAFEVYRRALLYPPSPDPEAEIIVRVGNGTDLEPLDEDLVRSCLNPTLFRVYDYDFRPLYERRVLVLKKTLFVRRSPVDILIDNRRIKPGKWYSRWSRTPESQQAERDFLRYVTSRFTAQENLDNEYTVHEYTCGFGDGFDIRETIRQSHTGRIYIRESVPVNTAAYIFDYRKVNPAPPSRQMKLDNLVLCETSYYDHVFMDRYFAWIGLTRCSGKHYTCGVMTAFGKLDLSPTRIFTKINSSAPLASSVRVALEYTKNLFVFTDSPEEMRVPKDTAGRVKVYPCDIIPPSIYNLMSAFDITGPRYDDRPGD